MQPREAGRWEGGNVAHRKNILVAHALLLVSFIYLQMSQKKKSALNVVNSFVFNKEDVSEAVMTKPAFPPTFALRNVAQCTDLLGLP